VKSGGRVMKNVTGLDLVKLMAGSWGTLGFLTEVTFKVLPKPERAATLIFRGLDDARAVEVMSQALGSPFEITGAAHIPGFDAQGARTLLRIEGFSFSVDHRLNELRRLLKRYGSPDILERKGADALWHSVRDATLLADPHDRAVWRVSTAPSTGPELAARVGRATDARWYYDWGGGLIWFATDPRRDAGAAAIREAVRATGGHATLIRAPAEVRASIDVFEPQAEALARISAGIKASFDPAGVLNPGRMYAGI
jgi:glycolate oxidase FAD binding subunit